MPTRNRGGGDEGRGPRRAWAPEFRLEVARAVVERRTPQTEVARVFGVPLTTVMDWTHRYRKEGAAALLGQGGRGEGRARPKKASQTASARRDAVTEAKRTNPDHGTRKIRDVLARLQGVGVSETTVRRILHEEGLIEEKTPAPAKVQPERRFERAEPNQLWQSDIFTFLLRRHQRVYVTAFMDDYSRYLVSLVIAHHQRSTLVLEALSRAIADYGTPREILTDQGRQYTAWRGTTDFEAELRRQGIHHIKSRAHHPETLGKIERFWKTLWEELLSRTVFADFDDCQRRVGLYVQAYNFRRPHQGIGGVVPADRFFRAAPQVRAAVEKSVAANAMALARAQPQRKPFYLVGRLGESDLSIALVGRGLFVKLGDREQTIPLLAEVVDEHEEDAGGSQAEEPLASDAAVAEVGDGPGPDRAGAVPDGAVGAVGREAGDGGDRGGGDRAADVLPPGDARPLRDAQGAGSGSGGHGGDEPAAADREAGEEGETPGAGEAAGGTAALDDAAGPGASENELDEEWTRSFAQLEETEEEPSGQADPEPFEPGPDWRGRALTWERKLAGAEAGHDEELHAAAGSAAGDAGAVSDRDGGPVGSAHGVGGSAQGGTQSKPLPEPRESSLGGDHPGTTAEGGGPAADAALGAVAVAGEAAASEGERASAAAGARLGPATGGGDEPGAQGAQVEAEDALRARGPDGGRVTSVSSDSPPRRDW
jgi:transposase InsO family protein